MAYLHKLDPFAIEIATGMGVRWYGLAYLAGMLLGYALVIYLAKHRLSPLSQELIGDFAFSVAMGTIIGGRLGYCIFYSPELFLRFESSFPFWGPLALNHGGMASHGGIAGIAVACIYFARRHNLSILHLGDLSCFGGVIGIYFGRIANFINGELVGRAAPPDYAWAVKFPQDIFAWPSYDPGRLASLAPAVEPLGVSASRWSELVAGFRVDASAWNAMHRAMERVVEAVQQGNLAVARALEPALIARYPSQLIQCVLEGALVFLVLAWIWRKPRKPGVVAGCFFVSYAIMRIVGEQFRLPDVQLGYEWLGLTRGQILSSVMLLIGLVCLIIWARRPAEKIGGWQRLLAEESPSAAPPAEAKLASPR